jgi:hypothetical protein
MVQHSALIGNLTAEQVRSRFEQGQRWFFKASFAQIELGVTEVEIEGVATSKQTPAIITSVHRRTCEIEYKFGQEGPWRLHLTEVTLVV